LNVNGITWDVEAEKRILEKGEIEKRRNGKWSE